MRWTLDRAPGEPGPLDADEATIRRDDAIAVVAPAGGFAVRAVIGRPRRPFPSTSPGIPAMAPTKPPATGRRYYTVEDANRALPLVRAIVADIVRQWQVVSELEQRLAPVLDRRTPGSVGEPDADDPYHEELAHRRAELDAEQRTFRAYLGELEKLGVELKGAHNGLCDFPSLRDGREVYLCWKLGESKVGHWHELHTGYSGRQPVEATVAPAGR